MPFLTVKAAQAHEAMKYPLGKGRGMWHGLTGADVAERERLCVALHAMKAA